MFDFPASALEKPPIATEQEWALLSDKQAPIAESAAAVAAIAVSFAATKPLVDDLDVSPSSSGAQRQQCGELQQDVDIASALRDTAQCARAKDTWRLPPHMRVSPSSSPAGQALARTLFVDGNTSVDSPAAGAALATFGADGIAAASTPDPSLDTRDAVADDAVITVLESAIATVATPARNDHLGDLAPQRLCETEGRAEDPHFQDLEPRTLGGGPAALPGLPPAVAATLSAGGRPAPSPLSSLPGPPPAVQEQAAALSQQSAPAAPVRPETPPSPACDTDNTPPKRTQTLGKDYTPPPPTKPKTSLEAEAEASAQRLISLAKSVPIAPTVEQELELAEASWRAYAAATGRPEAALLAPRPSMAPSREEPSAATTEAQGSSAAPPAWMGYAERHQPVPLSALPPLELHVNQLKAALAESGVASSTQDKAAAVAASRQATEAALAFPWRVSTTSLRRGDGGRPSSQPAALPSHAAQQDFSFRLAPLPRGEPVAPNQELTLERPLRLPFLPRCGPPGVHVPSALALRSLGKQVLEKKRQQLGPEPPPTRPASMLTPPKISKRKRGLYGKPLTPTAKKYEEKEEAAIVAYLEKRFANLAEQPPAEPDPLPLPSEVSFQAEAKLSPWQQPSPPALPLEDVTEVAVSEQVWIPLWGARYPPGPPPGSTQRRRGLGRPTSSPAAGWHRTWR
eukprot:gnl/TRDRNA2_/TRDRNA2_161013_c2_seq1.p1 gnl/TRDRNA2_/TRDRNA2_161013_c2~~gnl/TRDRNA2_/TRDRNA2_161013_c2_seq1.p1  ORF type:complete len:763 (+),score=140.82 gnl/TRDRNA2_/TRDRNA2_161013_c2_seq1:237-2291(+)